MCVLLDTATYYIKQNRLLSRCILQDIKNILPLLAGTRILCLTVTNAFHKFQESCLPGGILLEDTGVFKHVAEHNTDLIPLNSLGFFTLQAGAVLFDQTIDPVSVYSQRAAGFAAGVGGGTGQDIGGGTYAKSLPNIVAFGPIFPGDEIREHKPDEFLELSRLMENARIIAAAMYEMAK